MDKFQSHRQNKINSALQKEIAYLLQNIIRKENISNLMISVTKINVSPDLSSAKVYLSIFPNDNILDYLNSLNNNCKRIKHDLSQTYPNCQDFLHPIWLVNCGISLRLSWLVWGLPAGTGQ